MQNYTFCPNLRNNTKKVCKLFCTFPNLSYLCTRKRLGYGVMVTLQILVLPFLVRVRVAQRKRKADACIGFFFVYTRLPTTIKKIMSPRRMTLFYAVDYTFSYWPSTLITQTPPSPAAISRVYDRCTSCLCYLRVCGVPRE